MLGSHLLGAYCFKNINSIIVYLIIELRLEKFCQGFMVLTRFDSNRAVQPQKMDILCLHDTAHFIIMLSQLISASMLNLALVTCFRNFAKACSILTLRLTPSQMDRFQYSQLMETVLRKSRESTGVNCRNVRRRVRCQLGDGIYNGFTVRNFDLLFILF